MTHAFRDSAILPSGDLNISLFSDSHLFTCYKFFFRFLLTIYDAKQLLTTPGTHSVTGQNLRENVIGPKLSDPTYWPNCVTVRCPFLEGTVTLYKMTIPAAIVCMEREPFPANFERIC